MKQEQNNEMDLLLRNLGRTVSAAIDVEGEDGEHLDADELNAYAEKALPPAAHARYTKHIADCARCRKIAAELGVAAGVITEAKAKEPVLAPTGFKAFLASFFSPMVMRYSVPALALVMVAVVGWVIFQRSTEKSANFKSFNSGAQGVAAKSDNREATKDLQAKNNVEESSVQNPSNKSGDTKPETPKEQKTGADDSRQVKDAKNDQPITATDQVAAAPTPGSATSGAATAEPPPAVPKRAVALEPEARKAAPVVVAPAETVAVAKSNEKQEEKEAKQAQPTALAGNISGPNKSRSEVARTRGRGDSAPRDEEASKRRESDDKDAPETRSAGGRRFRKDGSVWIDLAYNGGATTNVSRGSEQYRALIADEPGIKTIADQFEGDIIIVWKGRAYKIK